MQTLPGFSIKHPILPPVSLGEFEGPLDVLLHLIRSQKMDIFNIPIALLTKQYLEMIEAQKISDLNIAGDYLIMASTLMQLKSRLLLPRPELDENGDEQDPRDALVSQLIAYEQYRTLAEELDHLPRINKNVFLRPVFPESRQVERPLPEGDLNALLTAFTDVLKRIGGEVRHTVLMEPISVREQMSYIIDTLKHGSIHLDALLQQPNNRESLIITLLAILELWRQQVVHVLQKHCYTPVLLMLKKEQYA